MGRHLLLTGRMHGDGHGRARFHGMAQGNPEWPPSPARLFQALVAGTARGGRVPDVLVPAFQWLETLPPPVLAAPNPRLGQRVNLFVPNNDADSLADPRDVSGIRTKKAVQASSFAEGDPFLYAWSLSEHVVHADTIAAAAGELYQLGRGVDMAWALGEVLDDAALETRLESYPGIVHRPAVGTQGARMLACPTSGSFASLVQRHRTAKLRAEGSGKNARVLFTNAPKPVFSSVSYERKLSRIVFELHGREHGKPWPWALRRVVKLVETLRDAAAARLREALPALGEPIERTLVGRKADGRDDGPIEHRIRIVPLPSIGLAHADRGIRRFLLDVPSGAPLQSVDVEWAFSGLEAGSSAAGSVGSEAMPWVITRGDDGMLAHYVGPSRRWRTVTPMALPESAKRRRIEPKRQRAEAKPASERAAEEDRAVASVHAALRHAGIPAAAVTVRVQREPFEAKGMRAETFGEGTRFAKERLWHVELELDRPVRGPVVVGDGRFLGLGVMAPAAVRGASWDAEASAARRPVRLPPGENGIFVLAAMGLEALTVTDQPMILARALRRAVMARVQEELGAANLERFFSGHEMDGSKATCTEANHLGFHWDAPRQRLVVLAPHRFERREPTWDERSKLETLDRALEQLVELRAGSAGRFCVQRASVTSRDPLLVSSHRWTSLTPYTVTRHPKRSTAAEALTLDVRLQCERHRLPRPEVEVLESRGVHGRGLEGYIQLDFDVAVAGPIILGRTRYLGGGLFVAESAG